MTPLGVFAVMIAVYIAFMLLALAYRDSPAGERHRAIRYGRFVQRALEDPETRAAIYDAMEQERMRRESGNDKPKRK
jgi:hypothetical protein